MQRVRGEWAFIAPSLFKKDHAAQSRPFEKRIRYIAIAVPAMELVEMRVFCRGGRGHWWSRLAFKGNSVAWMLQATASAPGYG